MELKEAIGKCEKAVKVLTGNDTGIRLDFEGTASAIDTVLEELNNRIPKKDIQEILDYQYDLWNTPNKQKEFNLELVETLENLLDKE